MSPAVPAEKSHMTTISLVSEALRPYRVLNPIWDPTTIYFSAIRWSATQHYRGPTALSGSARVAHRFDKFLFWITEVILSLPLGNVLLVMGKPRVLEYASFCLLVFGCLDDS
jgi:hypothetical protein